MSEPQVMISTDEDPSCLELLNEAVAGREGIVDAAVDTEAETVSFTFDPTRIGEREIGQIAHAIGPTLEERWQRCTMRLEKHGGRACESCALALERQVGQMPGVRRATASFSGVLAPAMTLAPMALPISIAAAPTPPAAPRMNSASPGFKFARSLRAYCDVP